jgi:hypothetical protein
MMVRGFGMDVSLDLDESGVCYVKANVEIVGGSAAIIGDVKVSRGGVMLPLADVSTDDDVRIASDAICDAVLEDFPYGE